MRSLQVKDKCHFVAKRINFHSSSVLLYCAFSDDQIKLDQNRLKNELFLSGLKSEGR